MTMPRLERANLGSGDGRLDKLKKMLPGSGFEKISEPYGEFIETGERFTNYFQKKGILEEVQYKFHGQLVDPRISVHLHGDTIVSINTYWKGSSSTESWPELEPYLDKPVTKEVLKAIAMAAIERFEEYISPNKKAERNSQMQVRVEHMRELLSMVNSLRRRAERRPSSGDKMQKLQSRLENYWHELATALHAKAPCVTESFESRMIATFKDLDTEVIVASYEDGRNQSQKMVTESDPEYSDEVYVKKMSRFNPGTGTRSPEEYRSNRFSRNSEMYGYTPFLLNLVDEVSDPSLLYDTRIREAAVMKDARRAVDLRLSQLGAVVHRLPSAPLRYDLNEASVTSDDQKIRSLYLHDAKEFIDLLVGLNENHHKHLYDPELAEKYGAEVVMNMSLDEAGEWIVELDKRVGYWQNSGQASAAEGLFVGIRSGLNARMDDLKQYAMEHPESRAWSFYNEVAMDSARFFRTQTTVAGKGPTYMEPVIFHPMLQNTGNDAEFSENMALRVLDFDSLSYEHATQTLGMHDPLSDEVDKAWPALSKRLAQKMGLNSLSEIGKRVPALTSMIHKVAHSAYSFEGSCTRFVLYHQLEAMADGTLASFNPSSVGGEIQGNAQFSKFVEEAGASFNTYLSKNYASLLSGKGKVGRAGLSKNQREALQLIKDMRGYGAFDLSDVTLGRIQLGSKIVVMVSAGIAVAVATGGMSVPAQMAAAGIVMTGVEVVMEGQAVGGIEEAVQVYGGKTVVNGLFVGFGKVLSSWRYAAQLRNLKPNSPAAREIFMKAMSKGGMAKLGAQYDDALHFGSRLLGASAEGVVDVTASSWVDMQLNPGTTFLENLYMNSMFLGLPLGMEFRRDVVQGMRMASDTKFRATVQFEASMRTEIDVLSALCGKSVDAQKVYTAADPVAVLKQAGIEDADQVAQILAKRSELKAFGDERATMLQDVSDENVVDITQNVETEEPLARLDVEVETKVDVDAGKPIAKTSEVLLQEARDTLIASKKLQGAESLSDDFIAEALSFEELVRSSIIQYNVATKKHFVKPRDQGVDTYSLEAIAMCCPTKEHIAVWKQAVEKWKTRFIAGSVDPEAEAKAMADFRLLLHKFSKRRNQASVDRSPAQEAKLLDAYTDAQEMAGTFPTSRDMQISELRRVFASGLDSVGLSHSGSPDKMRNYMLVVEAIRKSAFSHEITMNLMKAAEMYGNNVGLSSSQANNFIHRLIPAIQAKHPDVGPLTRGGNIWSIESGTFGVGEYICHCFASDVSPKHINELLRVLYEIPTSNLQKLEQNRIDGIDIGQNGPFGGLRDYIHDQRPSLHAILEGMVEYYDTGDDNALRTAFAQVQRESYAPVTLDLLLDHSRYDKVVKQRMRGEPAEIPAIDMLRRLVRNTEPVDVDPPRILQQDLHEALQSYHATQQEQGYIANSDLGEMIHLFNEDLVAKMKRGETGMDPSFVQSLAWMERQIFSVLKDLSFESSSGIHESDWYREVLRFQELTASAESFDEAEFVKFLKQVDDAGSADASSKLIAQRVMKRLQKLSVVYKEMGRSDRNGALWSGNTDHELMLPPVLRPAESKIGKRAQAEQQVPEWYREMGY